MHGTCFALFFNNRQCVNLETLLGNECEMIFQENSIEKYICQPTFKEIYKNTYIF